LSVDRELDLRPPAVLPPTDRRTVLYAPTWEDETASSNYTSVDRYGPAIVRAALDLPDVRVVYKPHPRIPLSQDAKVRAGHQQILQLLTEASRSDSAAGHQALTEGDILAVFPRCDLMITDVSSVGPDFLYLHTDKPLFITDPRNTHEHLHAKVPLSRCADIIDATTITVLGSSLEARLTHDEHRGDRERMRQYYFGDLASGESTRAIPVRARRRGRGARSSDSPSRRRDREQDAVAHLAGAVAAKSGYSCLSRLD